MLSSNQNTITFKSAPFINATMFIEDRVLLNKALLDGARDTSIILNANNRNEAEERFRRSCIGWGTAFLTPLVTLPLTNKLAMKHIAKLTKSYFSKDNNLVKLSNKYLTSTVATKQGIEELSKKYDFSEVLKNNNYDYEKIRKKLINAKMSVLAFDFLFTTSLMASAGFINRYITRKKTGKDGFSAEFNMANKDVIEKRAEKFKKTENLRNNIFIASLLLLASSPLLLRRGLLKDNGKLSELIKKHASKFDYNDGIFMKRLPFLLMAIVTDIGLIMSSRNQTEVKDNAVRLSATQAAFFGGDIIIGSTLAAISDKFFKTELLDKNCNKNWINKLIPPIKPIRDLQGKNKSVATGLFWVNMLALFGIIGIVIPKMLNRMIKHDVDKDVQAQNKVETGFNKPPKIEEFINR